MMPNYTDLTRSVGNRLSTSRNEWAEKIWQMFQERAARLTAQGIPQQAANRAAWLAIGKILDAGPEPPRA